MTVDPQSVSQAYRAIFRTEADSAAIDRFAASDCLDAAIDTMIADATDTVRLVSYYQVFFNRLPDPGGFDFWAQVLRNNPELSDSELAQRFFNAGEFSALYGGLSTEEAVTALYRNVLNREPDADGLAFWTNRVLNPENGFELVDLGRAFATTPETQTTVRRQNIWHNSRRRFAECGPRLGLMFRRRACGVASADIRVFVV